METVQLVAFQCESGSTNSQAVLLQAAVVVIDGKLEAREGPQSHFHMTSMIVRNKDWTVHGMQQGCSKHVLEEWADNNNNKKKKKKERKKACDRETMMKIRVVMTFATAQVALTKQHASRRSVNTTAAG